MTRATATYARPGTNKSLGDGAVLLENGIAAVSGHHNRSPLLYQILLSTYPRRRLLTPRTNSMSALRTLIEALARMEEETGRDPNSGALAVQGRNK